MTPTPLTRPVSTLMRATFQIGIEQTLGFAARRLRENSAGIIPVVDETALRGVVTERSLAQAIGNGHSESDGIEAAFVPEPPVIKLYETGAEALRIFDRMNAGSLVVVDDDYRVVGILRASDLVDPPTVANRPALIGGMATPFGVYLTTGSVSAGPGGWALVATGALLTTVLTSISIGCVFLFDWLMTFGLALSVAEGLANFCTIALFALSFRLLPISGTHAAEHMVVHTIERGEELIPSTVKRMPRVHPRCGTNLAVGASIYTSIAMSTLPIDLYYKLIFALVFTLLFWRRIGSWVQYWITTRPPTNRQIELGIQSGKELLEKYSQTKRVQVSFGMRLWNSGIFHVMAGSFLVGGLLLAISTYTPLKLPI